MKLRNDNEHRIYVKDADGKDFVVRAGAEFEGSSDDAKRPGVSKASSDAPDAAAADGSGPAQVTDPVLAALHQIATIGKVLATARIRDPNAVPEEVLEHVEAAAEAAAEVVEVDAEEQAAVNAEVEVEHHDDDLSSTITTDSAPMKGQPAKPEPATPAPRFSSPSAEKAAKKAGLDPTTIKPTGKGKRITVADVEGAAKS